MRAYLAVQSFCRCRSGATSIEYSVIGAGLSILIIGGAQAIGVNLKSLFFDKLLLGFTK